MRQFKAEPFILTYVIAYGTCLLPAQFVYKVNHVVSTAWPLSASSSADKAYVASMFWNFLNLLCDEASSKAAIDLLYIANSSTVVLVH